MALFRRRELLDSLCLGTYLLEAPGGVPGIHDLGANVKVEGFFASASGFGVTSHRLTRYRDHTIAVAGNATVRQQLSSCGSIATGSRGVRASAGLSTHQLILLLLTNP